MLGISAFNGVNSEMDIGFLFEINAGLHSFFAVIGLAAAFLAEIFYLKALRDGVVDERESKELRIIYRVLRWSILVLVFTGFGFFIKWRLGFGGERMFFNGALWAKYVIVAILLANAALMQARKIPFFIGAPISLVSWSAAFILGKWHPEEFSFLSVMSFYAAAAVVVGFILEVIRRKIIVNNKGVK